MKDVTQTSACFPLYLHSLCFSSVTRQYTCINRGEVSCQSTQEKVSQPRCIPFPLTHFIVCLPSRPVGAVWRGEPASWDTYTNTSVGTVSCVTTMRYLSRTQQDHYSFKFLMQTSTGQIENSAQLRAVLINRTCP